MSTPIKPKRSHVTSAVPSTAALQDNEIAVNSADRTIYMRVGAVVKAVANYFSGAFNDLTGKPTTVAGYGITDAASTEAANIFTDAQTIRGAGNANRSIRFENSGGALVAEVLGHGGGGMSLGGSPGRYIYLRPNGVDSSVGQVRVYDDGSVSLQQAGANFYRARANSNSADPQPRIFVRSSDPDAQAADGDLWIY